MANKLFFERWGFNRTQLLIFLVVVGYFVYLGSVTTPILNYNNETGTVMYGVDSYAPPSDVTNTQVAIGIGLLTALMFSFKLKDVQSGRVSTRKFKEFLAQEIKIMQSKKLPNNKYELPHGDFRINPNILTGYTTIGDKRTATKYAAQVTIIDYDGNENYYAITGNPVTMMIDDVIPLDFPLSFDEKNPETGMFPDEKIVISDDLKNIAKMKKALGGDSD